MGRIGLLQQHSNRTGVLRQFAGEVCSAKVHVAKQAVQRVLGPVVRRCRKEAGSLRLPVRTAASARSSLLLKWWKKLPLVTPARWHISFTAVAE